jgi:hypothetical protein
VTEVSPMTAAVLAPVSVAREQERVGHLATEAPWNVHVPHEADHDGGWMVRGLGPEGTVLVDLEGFRLAIDHEAEGPADRDDRKWLEGCV